MSKVRLSSNVFLTIFAVAAIAAAGCGGSSSGTDGGTDAKTDGGSGGKGGSTGSGGATGSGGRAGTGGAVATGGAGGGAGQGGGGAGGATTGSGGTAGGTAGEGGGGAGGAPTGSGGVVGSGGAMGGAGGGLVCPEVPVCTLNARTCASGIPQLCMANSLGCPAWVAQPACGTHQTCTMATGMCTCNNDARCMAMEGSFCPMSGAATFGQCTKDANGCFTVTSESMPCTSPQTCTATGVVATGSACGCPTNGTTLNTGCANRAVNDTIASATDNAVLRCEMVGTCKIWRILVNCADQSLTAGTDATTNTPACVCKAAGSAPGAANTLYVDPDPPMATFMTNSPTGALQPPACRYRRLRDALAATSTTFTRVVAIHETSSNVHFPSEFTNPTTLVKSGTPITVPAGIELTTADGPSFNPAHYTVTSTVATTPAWSFRMGPASAGSR